MRIHHLNCGSMRLLSVQLVCHVLLLETERGLVLVDSGYGLHDIVTPSKRVGPSRHILKPTLDVKETAARQVEHLGYRRSDVRHIIVTHFDVDHIGGIADFPEAAIHVTVDEIDAAMRAPTGFERLRYRASQWSHRPRIVEHRREGEAWRGFTAANVMVDISHDIVLIPMPGHTRGHACVAIRNGDRWLLHAGDAFYHPASIEARGADVPRVLRVMESLLAFDKRQVIDNHARLRDLRAQPNPPWDIFCAHDADTFEKLRRQSAE
ncbi:MBL fold metallo-hydrolase [Actinoplanes sp. CA-030573]|uniref:MBL fold metallo-hydrolase n=1 Tax=Actinoplanes sp. CA-030573 TaxID=3239898 RepID=UPI003D92D2E0